MSWPAIKFVDAPSTSATVRLDLSTDSLYVSADDLSLGVPTFDGSPTSFGVNYGYRDGMVLPVVVKGTKTAALAALQSLARETVRRTNWLLVQPTALHQPVWFKTFRSEPGALSLENIRSSTTASDLWQIAVPLVAEGFAYGERVTHSVVTVNNDPASGTNPCYFTLPAIKGDAPAPLRVAVDPSNSNYMNGYRWMIASSAIDGSHTPITWQVGGTDGWTVGADTSASTADATYSGGSYRSVSFATQTGLVDRISGASPTSMAPGRYKVLVRCARSDVSSKFSLRFGLKMGFSYRYGDTVLMDRATSTATGHATWVDLGEFVLPPGSEGVPLDLVGIYAPVDIAVQVGRTSGSGSARLDAIKLIPINIVGQVDSRVLFSHFPDSGIFISSGTGTWDGDEERFFALSQFGTQVAIVDEPSGGFPIAYPGMTNLLHVLQQVNGQQSSFADDASDLISVSTSVTVSYLPRYLNLRGD